MAAQPRQAATAQAGDTKTTAQLNRKIAQLQADIVLLEANRADITLGLLTTPDDPELKDQLGNTEKDIESRRVELERLAGALVVAQSRDAKAEEEANTAAREEAAKATRALMADAIKAAKEADKALASYVASLGRAKEINEAIYRGCYDAGVRGGARHHYVGIKSAGDVLAYQLIQADLHEQLNSMTVLRPSIEGKTLAEITEANFERLDSWISRALREPVGG